VVLYPTMACMPINAPVESLRLFPATSTCILLITIPSQLEQKLKTDPQLYSGVLATCGMLTDVLRMSRLPFFPDYTDHGLSHIEDVLLTAEALIPEAAWAEFTSGDAAVLVLSVLMHDLALHLSEDGFNYLLEEGSGEYKISGLVDPEWKWLWLQYLSEARRWDGRQLVRLFGKPVAIRVPPADPLEYTLQDRLLIGEFIRRYHHRLAHEFAVFGVPGGESARFRIPESLSAVADLAGFVARSHGLGIRSAMTYLEEKYDIRQFKRIHAVYLMTLLRVADYLQVDAARAPESSLSVRKIRSPISQLEWKTHHSVLDIRHTHADPEALYIHAAPADAKSYLRLKQWLAGIQSELDASWAILGEIYGRFAPLNKLGLLLRRIRSNLDDHEAFAEAVDYVPEHIRFDVADADLLKLLVKPLYGNNAAIGIRELMQNSVDAVLERRHWEPNALGSTDDRAVDVYVRLLDEDGAHWLEIEDRGVGMDTTIVTQYFLRAGASFRRSQAWRSTFEDSEGNSLILRSGRFGIGVLAAFLLGDEIEVSTRHVSRPQDDGLQFTASVDEDSLNVRRVTRDVGTTIRVRLKKEALEQLISPDLDKDPYEHPLYDGWDWYCLEYPRVVRSVGSVELKQIYRLPNSQGSLPSSWHRLQSNTFQDVQWTFGPAPQLAVNGIRVDAESISGTLWERGHFGIHMPRVSLFDPDGRLALNLQRDDLEDGFYPFHEELLDEVLAELLRAVVYGAPSGSPFVLQSLSPLLNFSHPAILRRNYASTGARHKVPLVATNSGVTLFDETLVSRLRQKTLILLPESFPPKLFPLLQPSRDYALYPDSSRASDKARSWVRYALGNEQRFFFGRSAPAQLPIGGRRVFLHKEQADKLIAPGRMQSEFVAEIREDWRIGEWVLWRLGECPEPNLDFEAIAQEMNTGVNKRYRAPVMAEWYLRDSKQKRIGPVAAAWKKYFRRAEIPYSREERIALARRGGLL
jgi:molecular chaperone HtpG